MSKNILKRVQQYRGYHKYGLDYPRIMFIYSKFPRMLERLIHKEISKKYKRIGKLEIFLC